MLIPALLILILLVLLVQVGSSGAAVLFECVVVGVQLILGILGIGLLFLVAHLLHP